ncbi:MAG: type II secretion system F family protein [Armatimonadetes bacterium]|nr:type II secretion system F family protein [Armatimonadota bacterium]
MRTLLVLIALLVAASVASLVAGLLASSSRAVAAERVVRVARRRRVGAALLQELSLPLHQRLFGSWTGTMAKLVAQTAPGGAVAHARQVLDKAGYPGRLTAEQFMAVRGMTLVAAAVLGLWVALLWQAPALVRFCVFIGLVIIGEVAPQYALDVYIRQRQAQIRKSLPDIMDLLVVSTEAGVGLDAAVQEVTKRRKGPLAWEFQRLLSELRFGKPRAQAWEDLANRVGIEEVRLFVTALLQAEQLGVSIAKTLRTQADALRSRRRTKIRIVAATMSVKMLFPLIFFIFPALLVVVLGPAVVSIMSNLKAAGF